VRGDARSAEGGGDAGGVEGDGAVHGAELRLQRLRRAGHVRVERHVGRRHRDRYRGTPAHAQGCRARACGGGSWPRPRDGAGAAAGGGRHRRAAGSKRASERTNRRLALAAPLDLARASLSPSIASLSSCNGLPFEMGPTLDRPILTNSLGSAQYPLRGRARRSSGRPHAHTH